MGTGQDIRGVWRRLTRLYSLVTMPFDFFFRLSSWRMVGSDLVGGVLDDGKARRASAMLAGLSEDEFAKLLAIADINVERASRLFAAVGIGYVTIPIALATLSSELAPDATRAFILEYAKNFTSLIGVAALTPLVYYCGLWRARQVKWAIELAAAGVVTPAVTDAAREKRRK